MQCPNCRKIEKGNWLYANGYHCSPEANMDDIDWTHDEELIDFFEQVHRVHWCPYSRYERISSPIEEAEFPTFGYHDLSGHQITFSEHAATSSAAQACPHVTFFQPLHPSSSNYVVSNEASIDGCTFQSPWSGPASSDIPTSHSFASADVHYSGWEHNSAPYTPPTSHVNGEDQSLMPFSSTMAGSFEHPFFRGPGSGSHAGSSVSTIPPSREVPTSYQHDPSPDFLLRPDTMWGSMASSEHIPLYFCLPPCPPLRLNLGAENPNHFYAWERDRLAPYPMVPPDRLPNRWTSSFNQNLAI
ncbi:hypothetical protein QJS04_geneDACA007262 [Acorus gramineus]|uniref:Uncharacterized protein n=1 Tax=Acorus gramineus TaxID=55184 RepID=A0AAV9BMA7_ACOGR|nr:hypothetical protein QJS04_geneDACA007262 [Acorus gramineus]